MKQDDKKSIEEIFAHLPEDPDTRILSRKLISVQGIPAVQEDWLWEGVKGKSLIVRSSDIPEAKMESMIKAILHELGIQGSTTLKQTDGLVFLNYGFSA